MIEHRHFVTLAPSFYFTLAGRAIRTEMVLATVSDSTSLLVLVSANVFKLVDGI